MSIKTLFAGLAFLLLSGCFEIIEEVSYKGKDNGSFNLTANCSKSKTRLKTLMKLDSFMGIRIPGEYEINEHISKITRALRETAGTSNIIAKTDMENFIFNITFDFDKTETLNKAINNAANAVDRHNDLAYLTVFSSGEHSFIRHRVPGDSMPRKDKIKPEMLKLISDASITSIYRFTSEVKNTTNKKSLISKNHKAVMLKQNISDIISHPELFTNTITF